MREMEGDSGVGRVWAWVWVWVRAWTWIWIADCVNAPGFGSVGCVLDSCSIL